MATPRVSDDPDVQAHYAGQAGLGALVVARVRAVWGRLAGVPDETVVDVVEALTTQFGSAAISLSADFYEDMRAKAGVSGGFRTPVIAPPERGWVESSIEWALDAPDTISTQTRVEQATEKMVADSGRNELIEAIESDREARGWARVARPGACAFCLMLATRGAVYKSESSARFEAHNNCHCTIVPLFADVYEPPAHIREAQALYRESTAGEGDKLNAFRRALAHKTEVSEG